MDKDIKVSLKNLENAEKESKRKISTPSRNGRGTFEIEGGIEKNKSYNYKNGLIQTE
jgi:hypothetical protein